MSATATLAPPAPSLLIKENLVADAHVPVPNPSDPMQASPGGPHYDDDGVKLCPRGRHRMVDGNKYKNTERCQECKNEDGRRYDITHGRGGGGSGSAGRKPQAMQTTTAPAPPPVVTAPATAGPKPSGILGYRTRDLAGKRDVDALAALAADSNFVMLYGPPGTGKTQLVRAAFPDALIINGDQDTTTGDFVGTWEATGNRDNPYEWHDGPLVTAMREGRKLFIDDATLIQTNVISVMYPVMDGQGFVQVKGHAVEGEDGKRAPEMVLAEDGFYVIGGYNPNAHGSYYAPALKSRFSVHVLVETEYELGLAMGMDRRLIKLCRNLSTAWHKTDIRACPQMREMIAYHRVQKILGDTAALQNLTSTVDPADMEIYAKAVQDVFGIVAKDVVPLALGKML